MQSPRISIALNLLVAFAIIVASASTAHARFMFPDPVPADRLVENLSKHLDAHPDDIEARYTLGRVHYLAFSMNLDHVGAFHMQPNDDGPPRVAPDWMQQRASQIERLYKVEAERRVEEATSQTRFSTKTTEEHQQYHTRVYATLEQLKKEGWEPNTELDDATRLRHVQQAIAHLHVAIRMDPDNALYTLTLANLYEDAATFAGVQRLDATGKVLPNEKPEVEQVEDEAAARTAGAAAELHTNRWLAESLKHYAHAFNLAMKDEREMEYRPVAGIRTAVTYRAAQGYQRILANHSDLNGDDKLAAAMTEQLTRLKNLPIGAITPIVFSFDAKHQSIADLLDAGRIVRFDLDGDDHAEQRPWLRPTTGILVWDPHNLGAVTSGRQLFGSVTWWMFWSDGYRALAALDNNADGSLTGDELAGLAVWFDRNADGRSDPGEVLLINQTDIAAIATHPTNRDDIHPTNTEGITLRDGSTRPTWDWIAPAIDE